MHPIENPHERMTTAARSNAGFASCYRPRSYVVFCSSCRRRRSAAKQSQTGVAMHERMTTATRSNAGFASCYRPQVIC